jgi:hypothetical protein
VKRAVALLALVVLACGRGEPGGGPDPPAVEAAYGEPFDLSLGERAHVGGFRVVFKRVAEDSRCPEGMRCVQARNAAAAFAVESDAGSATLTLNTDREPRGAAAMGYGLRLVELRPSPTVPPDSTAYVATLVVDPAP